MPFAEIVGQDRALSHLRRAWVAGRLSQAYCFAGPPGVGKRTAALALAQAVNCQVASGPPADAAMADACGQCVSCRKIAGGLHPDVMEVRPEGKTVITIDQVRAVVAQASLRAYEGKTKVWILDPADLMQEPAANALLKTLEEPPGASLFVLVTAVPSALLATILSRCQEVRFDSLGERQLQEILIRHGRTPEEAVAAAALGSGSAERALALDVAQTRAIRDRIVQSVWAALDSLTSILECAETLTKDRVGFEVALEILASFSRDLAVSKISGEDAPVIHADLRTETARLAKGYSAGTLARIYEAQAAAQRALVRHANPRFVAERMLLRMQEAVREGQEGAYGSHCSH